MSDEWWRLWLKRAKSNLARAELGRNALDILYEDLCFDAQQATEKALKGLMAFLRIRQDPGSGKDQGSRHSY